MKKIGVITTQYAPNYGAVLQTFALQHFLKSIYEKNKVEVINYIPPHSNQFWNIYPSGSGIKNFLLKLYLICHPKFIFNKKKLFGKFKKFIKENVSCSKDYFTFDELEKTENFYDVLICGSDQIWNITRHDDPVWFLYFSKNWTSCKKIAYAPSIADQIPEGHEENLKKYLKNLDYISVRESSDVKQLKKYTDKKIEHVCDPVFLLSIEEWEKYLPDNDIKEPYILCYFISTGDMATDVVKKMKELTGLKVVHVNVNIRDKFSSDYDIRTASPFEFVNYIKNATYVCTNSFHCTAFSILFKKNFLIIPKQKANSRMESLIGKVGIDNRFITKERIPDLTQEKLKIDYSKYNMQQWISESKEYLERVIKE